MLLTLDIKRLSPHQVTSVLGLIMQNDLAYPDGQIQNKFFDNNRSLSMEGCSLDHFIKQGNVSSFYDNGGGDVHQSNDTIQEFYLRLSDSKLQNAATTKAHLHILLAKKIEKKQMIRGRTMWDQTDGCAK